MYIMNNVSEASSNGIHGTLHHLKAEANEWKLEVEELKVSLKVAEYKIIKSTSFYRETKSLERLQGIKHVKLDYDRLEARLKYASSQLTTIRAQITFLKKAAHI
ncbi:hypothetical protein ACQKPX_21885 [Photobacterium sp. DNB23_23_1]|uniref:Uncharacterized protein n=1 Tax=Photobacterium pectinilyticum TaxID=2906793 RepID=A0ABT1N458_9GAMM|nr:hypothetical protein [Photobacterium sp. ZSDE20]MCQ1059526.1 hypothetical protein [Photobacterium sp. ZSDE20]MDD1825269.1 hypothetical protein [Photobacterium sp. ZSDE20]